jgi:imidazolonepropionase
MTTTLFRNARIFTPIDPGRPLAGRHQNQVTAHAPGALLAADGRIIAVGPADRVLAGLDPSRQVREIDCQGACMVPGFVDPHTHMCFARRREAEFVQRIAGTPYLEILAQGGGILSSVRSVRACDEAELTASTLALARSALAFGTTSLEIKSGYGLDTGNELKMLRAIQAVAANSPQDIVATFMGAHAVPEAFRSRPDAYADLVIEEMLPAVARQGIATACDVFCEKGVFSLDQSRRILTAAQAHGLAVKLHADEVNDLGGAGLAAEIGAVSAEHLLAASNANLGRMADKGVVATLLPATAYSLRKPFARAREMLAQGVAVALATDCNPGSSFTESMPFVIGLAVLGMGLTPEEALVGATLNAAHALGLSRQVGSLEPGKHADLLLLDGDSPAILAYHAGVSPVMAVFKHGLPVAGELAVGPLPTSAAATVADRCAPTGGGRKQG